MSGEELEHLEKHALVAWENPHDAKLQFNFSEICTPDKVIFLIQQLREKQTLIDRLKKVLT